MRRCARTLAHPQQLNVIRRKQIGTALSSRFPVFRRLAVFYMNDMKDSVKKGTFQSKYGSLPKDMLVLSLGFTMLNSTDNIQG
ncbi:hypothetical protein PPSC2_07255 [Paenibacillus polymyxa SC2]|uniref:Uncharacterized protein n=1 Tax=Paenibacillus polymyxa (strain SC2) TaxID=886882 RepID=A0A0D5ZC96_PAEPS|nr:hypothetical protein PPSC2_07255 [Paenibacillus polymyxa SC2]